MTPPVNNEPARVPLTRERVLEGAIALADDVGM
ncbi:MAG: hypothetical protein ACI81L_001402, partial [Verrucomicrobiales bacterium]